jgi:hypothetical protein
MAQNWMGQGARVSGNLFEDNRQDLFFEVDKLKVFNAKPELGGLTLTNRDAAQTAAVR